MSEQTMENPKGAPVKKPKVSALSRAAVASYYTKHFPWAWLESFATCNGRYPLERRVWWFFYYGEVPSKRLMFDTIEAVRHFVLQNGVMTMHLGAISALGREAVAIASGGGQNINQILTEVNRLPYSEFARDELSAAYYDRELIVDIDLNDYDHHRDPVCDCGAKRTCCDKCWEVFIARVAIPVIKYLFEDFFGFKEVMWVYSGRRGMHVHVQDPRAMRMTVTERRRIIYDTLIMGMGANTDVRRHLLETVYRPVFAQFIKTPEVTDNQMIEQLRPRLDEGFWGKDLGHMVKCPWTLHLATGNVCMPLKSDFIPSKAVRADLML
jgi:DNA primase catalytic subunit